MFPILDPALKKVIKDRILNKLLEDNLKSWTLSPDQVYSHLVPAEGEKPVNSQEWFMQHAMKGLKKKVKLK